MFHDSPGLDLDFRSNELEIADGLEEEEEEEDETTDESEEEGLTGKHRIGQHFDALNGVLVDVFGGDDDEVSDDEEDYESGHSSSHHHSEDQQGEAADGRGVTARPRGATEIMEVADSEAADGSAHRPRRSGGKLQKQRWMRELLEEKDSVIAALKAENDVHQRELETQRRECEYYRSAAAQTRDGHVQYDAELRRAAERYTTLDHEFQVHKQLSQRLLEERGEEVRRLSSQLREATASPAAAASSNPASSGEAPPKWEAKARRREKELKSALLQAQTAVKALEEEKARSLAVTQNELAALHSEQQQWQQVNDQLRRQCAETEESLKGEVLAHSETTAALKHVQSQLAREELFSRRSALGGGDEAGPDPPFESPVESVVQLQQLSGRVLELESSLAAALHDAVEWKESYERLAERSGEGSGGLSERFTTRVMVGPSQGSSGGSKGQLRNSRRLTQLARRGRPVRAAVATLSFVDDISFDFLELLARSTVLRLFFTYYVIGVHFLLVWAMRRFLVCRASAVE